MALRAPHVCLTVGHRYAERVLRHQMTGHVQECDRFSMHVLSYISIFSVMNCDDQIHNLYWWISAWTIVMQRGENPWYSTLNVIIWVHARPRRAWNKFINTNAAAQAYKPGDECTLSLVLACATKRAYLPRPCDHVCRAPRTAILVEVGCIWSMFYVMRRKQCDLNLYRCYSVSIPFSSFARNWWSIRFHVIISNVLP